MEKQRHKTTVITKALRYVITIITYIRSPVTRKVIPVIMYLNALVIMVVLRFCFSVITSNYNYIKSTFLQPTVLIYCAFAITNEDDLVVFCLNGIIGSIVTSATLTSFNTARDGYCAASFTMAS